MFPLTRIALLQICFQINTKTRGQIFNIYGSDQYNHCFFNVILYCYILAVPQAYWCQICRLKVDWHFFYISAKISLKTEDLDEKKPKSILYTTSRSNWCQITRNLPWLNLLLVQMIVDHEYWKWVESKSALNSQNRRGVSSWNQKSKKGMFICSAANN